MTRRLLITGASGGLGLALVAAARAAGFAVRATGRSAAPAARLAALGADYVRYELTDPSGLAALCADCDTVIHAAALSASWGPAADFAAINLTATAALLDAARRARCQRFVFISSPSIFAGFAHRIGIRADDPPADPPLNDYARTKLAAERLVLAAHGAAMACVALRPRAIVGPDDRVLLPRLAALARRRRMPLPGGGAALIELTDVRDAARAVLLAEDQAEAIGGRAINISGGQPLPVRTVAERLAAALGTTPQLVALPIPLARAAAVLAETTARLTGRRDEPLLTRYTLATLAFSQTFDADEAAALIGYRPQHDALATLLAAAAHLHDEGSAA